MGVAGLFAVILAVLVEREGGQFAVRHFGAQMVVTVEADIWAQEGFKGVDDAGMLDEFVQLGAEGGLVP